jgi:2-hydroxychromene-2-carboxylate isomerase
MEPVRFYFSFRSPYAWLGYHRVGPALGALPVKIQTIPVFPPPDYPNDPAAVPAKLAYIVHDAGRIAEAYGLPPMRWRGDVATDWMRPHAAYVCATDQGKGDAFAMGVFEARFCEARNVGTDDTLREVAVRCGLEPDALVAAADDPAVHQRVGLGMLQAREDGIFGVPFFAWRDQRYWGNDRLEWLVRDIRRAHGERVADLAADPMAAPSSRGPSPSVA